MHHFIPWNSSYITSFPCMSPDYMSTYDELHFWHCVCTSTIDPVKKNLEKDRIQQECSCYIPFLMSLQTDSCIRKRWYMWTFFVVCKEIFSEPMMVNSLTHICFSRSQCFNLGRYVRVFVGTICTVVLTYCSFYKGSHPKVNQTAIEFQQRFT